jgi:agmatinase
MLNRNIETFIGCDSDYKDATAVLFGAPFDSTTSFRPGARFGCREMRSQSFGLETYSPYLDRDLTDIAVFDGGDLELCFGDASLALRQIEEYTAEILRDGKTPVMLGGEHLVTLGAFRAVFYKYPDVRIVHFDAHADLRDDYLGATLSHASVLRRCHDLVSDGRIYQFGIRSGDRSEFEFARVHTHLRKFDFGGLPEVIKTLRDKPVYLTIDLDVLDPSEFPGTGTPEAGGVGFMDLIGAIKDVCALNIVGCDLVELSPVYDQSGISTAVACKVLRELLLLLQK